MKVLHISTLDTGGAGLCCVRISKALREAGIDSKVLVQEKFGDDEEVYPYYPLYTKFRKGMDLLSRKLGVYLSERNKVLKMSVKFKKQLDTPTSYCNLLQHSLVREADIVNIHWANGFIDIPSFVSKIDKPVVFTLHDENFFYGLSHYSNDLLLDDPFERKYYDLKRRVLVNNKNIGIVFLSKFMYEKYRQHEFIQDKPITVINNAVDVDAFTIKDRNVVREKLGISSDKYVISFMAASIDDPRKGLQNLVKAVEQINDCNIMILAIGSDAGKIKSKYLVSLGSLKGARDLSQALSASNLFVMPSCQEAFAQSPIEAMACGVPTVVYPCSGSDELAERCDCIRCADFIVDELVKAIKKSMDVTIEPQSVREKVIQYFSPQHLAGQYVDFYDTMLTNFNKNNDNDKSN